MFILREIYTKLNLNPIIKIRDALVNSFICQFLPRINAPALENFNRLTFNFNPIYSLLAVFLR